jgi:hypothetical protein
MEPGEPVTAFIMA